MDVAFASLFHPPAGASCLQEPAIFVSTQPAAGKLLARKRFPCLAAVAAPPTRDTELDVENRKHRLLNAIQDTQRGLVTTADQRSSIEEALVSVENCDAGVPIDLGKLDGTWRLQYTSAPDVLVLLESSARLPFLQVGQIFQKFECRNQSDGGVVRNVVRWSIPDLLEEQEGATLLVSAKFSVVSLRNIYLQFEDVAIQNINISDNIQALIAPAILPRSFLSLQIQIPSLSMKNSRKFCHVKETINQSQSFAIQMLDCRSCSSSELLKLKFL
ncbi:probable plastid-lipid-associated protein 10, chloroplastic isoform X2 [Diospyros lotus]|uniref:probable plastid-lipid-associated protein 10, chloroplastic isoform X2 n=1 Tax=Diospyros lotus TaxID=55363 RepID=UPI00224DD066|nr:probable plastid-lipid-associated protein 10, chloroplastic isoform X2 [Diospyros lotus]